MKLSYQALLLSAVAFGMCACSADTPWGNGGEGKIALRLTASADVKDAIPVLRSAPALEAPSTSDFSVSLTNLVTSEVRKWDKLEDFNNQSNFPTGSYTLTAYYGDPDEEGFEKPYFTGSADIQVLEGRQTDVNITASLAHTMVSVEYSDRFREYFRDYAVTAHSEGHSYVEFNKNELRPAFLIPGEVSLAVNVTNPSGKTATIQPAAFPAAPKYHYHLTFDVNTPPTGDAQLQIIFDDNLTQEDVTIDLTEELFSSPAPSVSPSGFADGQTLELLSGMSSSTPLLFNVIARGGIASARLSISGDGLTLPFGNEVELVNASQEVQSQLESYGIMARGFFKNPETMGIVDVTGLASHLPDGGKYNVSLVVKDPYTRVSEPASLNISTVPVEIVATPGSAIFNSGRATVNVSYNGLEPEKNIFFKALSKAGVYKDCEVLSVTEGADTRSFEVKNYIFVLTIPDTDRAAIPLKLYFGNQEKQSLNVEVVVPQYTIQVDAFAKFANVKVVPENDSDLASIVSVVHLATGNEELPESSVHRNPDSGIISIYDLIPGKEYSLKDCLTSFDASTARRTTFSTEADTDVPNGDFSQISPDINMTNIQVGGEYTGTAFSNPKYHYTSDIVRSIPAGWSSINAKTCWTGASNLNTWFCVPSTYVENGIATIRSVGFNHAGSTPGVDKTTVRYYNANVPAFADSNKVAGELFLGEYSFNGSEQRNEGKTFTSRPRSLSFEYSYNSLNGEKGRVVVEVLDASGNAIAAGSSELEATGSMTVRTIPLSGYSFGSRAAQVKIKFISSNAGVPAINIPSGDDLNEYKLNGIGNGLKNNHLSANSYHAFASGSELKVTKVKFNY